MVCYIKNNYIFFCLGLLFTSVACTNNSNVEVDKTSQVINVVLLAGQSNMEGAGNYDELSQAIKNRITATKNRVQYALRDEEAGPLTYKTSDYHKKKYGAYKTFGPEMLIGLTLAEAYPNKRFLLLKTAYGGTSLYGAWNPYWTKANAIKAEKGYKENLPLFSMFSENINKQLTLLDNQKQPYKIIGMLWLQGENDASKEFSAIGYQQNLTDLIKELRHKFNFKPFVIGQINSTYGKFKQGPEIVRNAMQVIADEDVNVDIVNTSINSNWLDYPKHDYVHYNTEGQVRLGKEFAKMLMKFN